MELIDLLNKIKNGENVPKIIVVDKEIYEWDILEQCYRRKNNGDDLLELCIVYRTDELLNKKIELIADEIDIDNIEEYKQEHTERCIDIDIRNKINELIIAIKQLDKKVKKLED